MSIVLKPILSKLSYPIRPNFIKINRSLLYFSGSCNILINKEHAVLQILTESFCKSDFLNNTIYNTMNDKVMSVIGNYVWIGWNII